MLRDNRLAKRFAEETDTGKPARPGLLDYDRVAREIHRLTQQLVWLHRTMAGSESADKIPMPLDPVYPAEEFQADIEAEDDAKFWSEVVADNPTLRLHGTPEWN